MGHSCNRNTMKPHSLSIILLFLLVNILLSKHLLVEVEDDGMKEVSPDEGAKTLEDLAIELEPKVKMTYDEYVKAYNKHPDPNEKKMRADILKKNQEEVLKHNMAYLVRNVTWTEGITEYSDWTAEEVKKLFSPGILPRMI